MVRSNFHKTCLYLFASKFNLSLDSSEAEADQVGRRALRSKHLITRALNIGDGGRERHHGDPPPGVRDLMRTLNSREADHVTVSVSCVS